MNSFGPMVSALVGAFLLLNVARGQTPTQFEIGKEYQYKYVGYSLTGRPDSGKFSGFKLDASICLSAIQKIRGGFHMQLRFESAKLDQVNGDISPFRPEKADSPRKLTATKALKEIKEDFTKGVLHFNWRSGSIDAVRRPKKESPDLTNLKKGALGMFNFNLKWLMGNSPMKLVDWRYEEGLEGRCKTGYVAIEKGKNRLTLERIRNLYDCKMSSAKVHSFLRGTQCSKDGRIYNTPLMGDSRTTLELTRESAKKYFVLSAKTISQFILPNPNAPELMVGSYIAQELTFDKVSNKPKISTDKLQSTLGRAVVTLKSTLRNKKDSNALRKEMASYLATMKKSGNEAKFNRALQNLVFVMRMASEKDLQYALKQAEDKGDRVKNAVYEVFGNVGTSEAQKIILSKISGTKTSDAQAACMLRTLAFSTFHPSVLETVLMRKANSKRLRAKDRVRTLQTLWMMVGVLHCRMKRKNDARMARWLKQQFNAKHPNMDNDAKITTLLMALGNSGSESALNDMLKRAEAMKKAKKLTLHMRLHCLHALRKFAARPRLQSRIRTILWPIFANYMEDTELRIMAFQYLMKTSPGQRHMAILMIQLRQERCRHVRAYVVSYLQMIAKSGRLSPCRAKIAQLVRWALPSLPGNNRWNPGMFESRILFFPVMKSMGVFVSLIYCRHSPLPRSVTMGELFANQQSETNIWSITMRSEESGVLLRNIASPGGSIIDRVKTLFKEFKGEKGKSKSAQTTVHASMSGEDVAYYGTTFLGSKSNMMQALQTLLKNGRKNAVSQTLFMDTGAHLPTSFGTTLNWWSGVSTSHGMNFVKKKSTEVKWNFGHTSIFETGLGFSYSSFCGHTMMRYFQSVHPGKPHDVTMTLKTKSEKVTFAMHVMPHKNVMTMMQMGVQFLQVIRDGSGKSKEYPVTQMADMKKAVQRMGAFQMTLYGFSQSGFSRMTRVGEMNVQAAFSQPRAFRNPYELSLKRFSKFCGFQVELELQKAPQDPVPPRTTRIGAQKRKLLKSLASGKIRNSPSRPYERPLGLQRFAKAKAKATLTLYKMKKGKRQAVSLGFATVKIGPSGDNMDLKIRPRLGDEIKVSYNRRVVKALPYYDINNPFTITANSGSEGTLTISMGKKKIATLKRTSSISKYWIKEWTRLLKNPASVASTWPDVYHCYNDIQNGFFGTPCCYRAWRELQTYDTVSTEVDSGLQLLPFLTMIQERIGSKVARLYSFVQREKVRKANGNLVSKMSASFCPSDVRAVDNNRKYYARVLDGFPRRATCTVTYFQKQRQFYVRTFDGLNYAGSLPGKSTKGKSFVLARDCKRGEFTIGVGSNKKSPGFISVDSTIEGKPCRATAYQFPAKRRRFSLKGKGCDKMVKTGQTGRIPYVDFKAIGVKMMLTGKTEVSIQVDRMVYLNSLHGLCGNFDRDPEHMELMGCKNNAVTYFSNDKSGWDAMIKSYMTADVAKFKDCA